MLSQGKYIGHYAFNNKALAASGNLEGTLFTMTVKEISGEEFTGEVADDYPNAGTEGVGTIEGVIDGDNISFVKQMPYYTSFVKKPEGGYSIKVDKTRKHPPIYYKGTQIENNTYKGTWGFRIDILTRILLWLSSVKPGGTWEMKLETNE